MNLLNNLLKFQGTQKREPSKGDQLNQLRRKEAELNIERQMYENRLGILGEQKYQLQLLPCVVAARHSMIQEEQAEVTNKILGIDLAASQVRQQIEALQGLKG